MDTTVVPLQHKEFFAAVAEILVREKGTSPVVDTAIVDAEPKQLKCDEQPDDGLLWHILWHI